MVKNSSAQAKKEADKEANKPLGKEVGKEVGKAQDSMASTEQVAEAPKASKAPKALRSKFALKLPKKPPKLLLLGSALLLAGGAVASLNFAQRAPKKLLPAGTQLVPKTALATMTVTTDELTWTKLRGFGTTETQQQFDSLLKNWRDRLFTANGYSFKRDIKPWIGDRVTLAILSDDDAESSAAPKTDLGGIESIGQNLVLVVPIDEPLKAKALLAEGPKNKAMIWSDGKAPLREDRTYKGITVTTVKATDGSAVESAVIGTSWLLLSNSKAGIEQAINTHKGGRSLLDIAGYRKAAIRVESPQPPGKNFAQIYLNIPEMTQAIEPGSGTSASRNRRSIIPLQSSEGLVATALIESEGIRFQGTSWLSPKNDLAYSRLTNAAGDMPRRLPDDTLVMASGSNLQRFWQGFSEGNSSPPFFPDPQNLKAGLLTQTGLDLDEDIMPWAAGEFAFGVLPPPETPGETPGETSGESNAGADAARPNAAAGGAAEAPDSSSDSPSKPMIESAPLMLMVQTNDRQMAESAWSQLDDVMASRYRYKVETEEFDGGSATKWISPFQGVQFSHGWLPGNVAFFAVGDSALDAIAPSPNRPLAANRLFQTLTSQAPEPNNGHFYLDLAKINQLEGGIFPLPALPQEGATAAIQAIGMTSTVGDGGASPKDRRTMDYDLYVKLAKASRPEPF